MKCAVFVYVWLSVINCHGGGLNVKLNQHATPLQLPLQFIGTAATTSESDEALLLPQRTQPYQSAPSTTLSRIVQTKYGKLQGLTVTLFPGSGNSNGKNAGPIRNRLIDVFLSVPYALPPIKAHRFSPTQTPVPWEGVRTVIKPGFVCPQVMPEIRDESAALKDMPKGYLDYLRKVEPYLRNQSEDCLYLNIFAPAPAPAAQGAASISSRLKPVLVFIHGGKFAWGSGNLYDGTLLSAYADVLFVTLNYRLGVLGFLNVNSSPASKPRVANYGLMDQIAALHWIKENIAQFGGDSENITLMGYEAGAACVCFLMSSPAVVPGLFHRVMLIAGSAKAPWALVDDAAAVANALAESLNCSASINQTTVANSSQTSGRERDSMKAPISDPLLDCLKNKHFSYFTKFATPKFSVDFGPSVDGIVIPQNFWSYSEPQYGKKEKRQSFDMLFGLSSAEMMTGFAERDLVAGIEVPRRDAILRTLIRNSYRFHRNEILATITNEYVDWERGIQHPMSARDLMLNAVTDCLSLAPVVAASETAHLKQSYFYVFDHPTKDGPYAFQKSSGAGGGEDLNYFFGFPLMERVLPFFPNPFPSNYTRAEMALSETMLTYLSNFVYTGNPNEPNQGDLIWPLSKEKNKFRNVGWDPYDRLHQKYLELSASKIRIRSHYRAHQMAVWLRLVPELQRTGAAFVSALHNRMHGGYDPALYVGSFRLPEELEAASEIHHFLDSIDAADFYYNGSGISPSPPTCFSPLSSISADLGKNVGAVGASVTRSFEDRQRQNGTLAQAQPSSFLTTYANNLPLTIGVGCSLLILNLIIFAVLYYHHKKRRSEEYEPGRELLSGSAAESQQLHSYSHSFGGSGSEAPPELLQSNSTRFHQSQSQSLYSCSENTVNFATFSDHQQEHQQRHEDSARLVEYSALAVLGESESSQNMILAQRQPQQQSSGIYFSQPLQTTTIRIGKPQRHESNHYQPQQQHTAHQQPHINVNMDCATTNEDMGTSRAEIRTQSQSHANAVASSFTLPIRHQHHRAQNSEGESVATSSCAFTGTGGGTLPRKPNPPARNISNFQITQRQLFSVIISMFTFGIL